MLTCIARSRQLRSESLPKAEEEEDVGVASTLGTRQAIKSLTSQIKEMALKASGAYKHCKPGSGRPNNNHNRNCPDSESESVLERFRCGYRRAGNPDSTPILRGNGLHGVFSSDGGTPESASGRSDSPVGFMEEDGCVEWVAQVEPGVLITFVSLPNRGGNDLKRIRFSCEMFNKCQAQQWWTNNYDKVMELYNVQRLIPQAAPLPIPPWSQDEISKVESSEDGLVIPPISKELLSGHSHSPRAVGDYAASSSSKDFSREIGQSDEPSVSNASEMETEWVEEDEPGVYITIRALPGGPRELKRIRFSRERFGEIEARLWLEENRSRIQRRYL
ncbi:unnamed protein product [Cuscuta epithymum]|uniref:BRX domain-containing protein n=1 Tax=Cuscuta epithymum TaxID=186058 RepID=A0AAV0EYD9_9ASTE|nr:unnamed protein product [Cuscuta epithymum]